MEESLKNNRILITGSGSIVAKDLKAILLDHSFSDVISVCSKDIDLTRNEEVVSFFERIKPDIICHIAARAANVTDNSVNPWDVFNDNTLMELNVCDAAKRIECEKIIWISSDAALPYSDDKPMSEECLFDGHIDPMREPYGLAKAVGIKMLDYLSKQTGIKTVSLLPCYIYGNTKKGLVYSIVRDVRESVKSGKDVVVWGSRDENIRLIHSYDVANAVFFSVVNELSNSSFLVNPEREVKKEELVQTIAEITGFKGRIVFDDSKRSNPTTKTESSLLKEEGWKPVISLKEGISRLNSFLETDL